MKSVVSNNLRPNMLWDMNIIAPHRTSGLHVCC